MNKEAIAEITAKFGSDIEKAAIKIGVSQHDLAKYYNGERIASCDFYIALRKALQPDLFNSPDSKDLAMNEVEIKITNNRTKRFIGSIVGALALFLLPMFLGIILNNGAIQWTAFIYSLLLAILVLYGITQKQKDDEKGVKRFSNKQEAIDYINSL